jgi:hypothetical protein
MRNGTAFRMAKIGGTCVLDRLKLGRQVEGGSASIADLAKVSASDPFNQDTNPNGLQRDLSASHSRDAYRYAEGAEKVPDHIRAWSEVLLNVRDPSVVKLSPLDEEHGVFELDMREELINKSLARP